MPHPPATTPDAALLCPTCGYDVRGLPADGRCPGCGSPIATALAAHHDGPPRPWRRRAARGFLFYIAGTILLATLPFVPLLVSIQRYRWIPMRLFLLASSLIFYFYLGVAALGWLLALIAAWHLTRPEPQPAGPPARTLSAIWLLSLAFVSGVIYLVTTPLDFAPSLLPPGRWTVLLAHLAPAIDAGETVNGFLGLGWDFLVLAIAANLARRALRIGLAREARVLQWLVPLLALGAFFLGISDVFPPPRTMPPSLHSMLHVILPYALLLLTLLWQLVVLWRVAMLLRSPQPILSLSAPRHLLTPQSSSAEDAAPTPLASTGGSSPAANPPA